MHGNDNRDAIGGLRNITLVTLTLAGIAALYFAGVPMLASKSFHGWPLFWTIFGVLAFVPGALRLIRWIENRPVGYQ